MTTKQERALAALATLPAPMTHGKVQQLHAELPRLFAGEHAARTLAAAVASGAELLAEVRDDRAAALEYATAAERAKLLAQHFRDYARALDEGAVRINTALTARDDRAEILAEVKGAGIG